MALKVCFKAISGNLSFVSRRFIEEVRWKLHIMQYLFNYVVKGYKNGWDWKLLLEHMLCKIVKGKTIHLYW